MKKRIFSIFMVFTLCFVSVDQVYADAGSIIIAGGSVAGVTAGAIAGPAVVAVFCAMMAFGMNVELTQASEEAGMTKTEFLKNKIQEYCNEAQISANTFNHYVLDQAQILQNGAISISDQAGKVIERFCNWLFASEQVVSDSTGILSSVNVNGLICPVIQPGGTYQIGGYNNGTVTTIYNRGTKPLALVGVKFAYQNIGAIGIYAFTTDVSTFNDFSISTYVNDLPGGSVTKTTYDSVFNNVYGVFLKGYPNNVEAYFEVPYYDYNGSSQSDSFERFCNGITTDINFGNGVIGEDSITGDMDQYDLSKHVLNPADNETIVINPNITIPVPDDKDITIDVNEYLDVVQDLIDGLRDDVITAIDNATGVPITIEFDPTQDWDPTIEKEDDTELPDDEDKTPVVPDELIPIDYNMEPLKFDLKGFFPFCLPWDIRDMLSKLNAPAQAPFYVVDWDIPYVDENFTFTIDLSPYNDVASVLRKMEVLAFCVGLALITRQMILRG